jgi:hypothetical protein
MGEGHLKSAQSKIFGIPKKTVIPNQMDRTGKGSHDNVIYGIEGYKDKKKHDQRINDIKQNVAKRSFLYHIYS